MNVNKVLTKDYEKRTLGERGKNKPNTNPIQTQYKANSKPIQTQFKANQSQLNPISKAKKCCPGLGTVLALKHFGRKVAIPAAIFVFICIITASIMAEVWQKRQVIE